MKWISVDEKLPELFEDVLMYDSYGVMVGCMNSSLEFWRYDETSPEIAVTHWMPLPESPEDKDE